MLKSFIPALVVLGALVAACSGTGSTPAPTAVPATVAPSAAATPAPTLGFTVALAPAGFFVSSNGLTLYAFDKDTAGVSNCTSSQCVQNWPALTVASAAQLTIGAGLNESDFGTISRTDGTTQVTFKDVPLYNFAGDSAPGDKNGDGVGGIWHLATKATVPPPTSEPSTPASAPASAPAGSAGAGVCYDAHYQVVPCPSTAAGSPAAGGSNVSISAAGNLVDATGRSLYEYDKDTTPGSSACTADCLTNWPALAIAAGTQVTPGTGLDAADFTTFVRTDDSTTQVAYYAKPLYYFAGDTAAGDTNGANVSASWHLAMPQ